MNPRPAGPSARRFVRGRQQGVRQAARGRRAVAGARPGETVAFLGPNGAGKSTSLDMLLALRKPTSGRIRMFGSDPYHAVKSGRVGAMLQSGGLMPEVTVRELVTLVTGFHPRPLPVDQTLRRAGITDIAGRRVDKLSGGQTQRVRFALAIVGESDLIVLDEPTTAMDVETRQAFWANMNAEVAEGRTLLFATHYLEEADQAADRILVINQGRLLADGTPAQIKARAGAKRISFRLDQIDRRPCGGCPRWCTWRSAMTWCRSSPPMPTAPCTPCSTPATGRGRSRCPASAWSRRSWPSPRQTTTDAAAPAEAAYAACRGGRSDERHVGAGPRRGAAAGPEQAVQHLLGRAPGGAVPGGRAAGQACLRLRGRLRGVLHDRDGLDRRVQRGADRQRAAHLPRAQGRLDPAAAAHLPARQRLRAGQGHRVHGHHHSRGGDRAGARPLLRRRPPGGLEVAGHRGRDLAGRAHLRRAGGGDRLPVHAGHGPARGHVGVLRHVDPGRPVVRAGRLDAEGRAGAAHLPDHPDRHAA